jgi:hypothetical protein
MTKTISVLLTLAGLAVIPARSASAQALPPSQWLVSVNVGAQTQRHDYVLSNSFPLYDETASFETRQHVGNGVIVDASAARLVWRKLSIVGGFSTFRDSDEAVVTATIPHPEVFDQFVTTTTTVTDLKHSELGVHFSAMWTMPVTNSIDVALFAGPSIVHARKDVVPTVSVPPGTQDSSPLVVSQSGTHLGINIGVDASYRLTERYGVGLFLRHAGGTVNLESLSNLKVGGVQAGIGVRLHF